MRIAMIGGKTSTSGFRPLGVDTYEVAGPADAPEVWKRIRLDEYSIVFVTEPVYQALKGELVPMTGGALPVITVIPAVTGSREVGIQSLRAMVERAVGTDVMFRE